MVTTAPERVIYASKSRKWNSTQAAKFPVEFPEEHAANLEWIKKMEQEAMSRDAERMAGQTASGKAMQAHGGTGRKDGRGKWIFVGIIGILFALRGWQRFRDM
jgi:glutamate synthase domain-containing protein 3